MQLVEGGRVLGQVAKAPWHGVWRCWEAKWRRRWGIHAAKHTRAGCRGLLLPELAPIRSTEVKWLQLIRMFVRIPRDHL